MWSTWMPTVSAIRSFSQQLLLVRLSSCFALSLRQPRIAIALAMVAQQILLSVADTGRRRSRSPSSIIEGRPNPRRAIPRADPGPAVERGRAWVPAPTAAAAAAAVTTAAAVTVAVTVPTAAAIRQLSFRTPHPSFAMSDAAGSNPPPDPRVIPATTRARAKQAAMPRTTPSANDVEVEGRLGQLEWHARATEARLGAAEQRIEATGQLAGQLDGFAASVAE